MAKRNGSMLQPFSLRRIIIQRARCNEVNKNEGLSDAEKGKSTELEKTKHGTPNTSTIIFEENPENNIQFSCDFIHPKEGISHYCSICYLKESTTNSFFTLDLCGHRFCITCLIKYLKNEINESRTDIACPQCSSNFHPNNIEFLLLDLPDFKNKYEDFMIRRFLVSDPDSRWCPAPDCSYAVIASGCASCPQLQCKHPKCGIFFCYHCKAEWHPNQTCDTARTLRQNVLRTSSFTFSHDSTRRDEIKPCPRCQVLIVKMNDGSCNHMICSVCGAEFCWLCMKEVSDLHYLSPSGCTFWGKKPWSRKKKIVWQIGTLIGAPIGIALLAGIAVPSMIIGIPIWVGRKLIDRYKTKTKKKRNISVTIGVTASIIISPILAGLAIAIGVPILLFYVYGVVPVSLCRAGCGSSSNEEYKFDINIIDENRDHLNSNGTSIDDMSRLGGLSIGDISLSAASGSLTEVINNQSIHTNHNSYKESTTALAGSVQNQKTEYNDSQDCDSAVLCNSENSLNINDTISNNILSELTSVE